MSLLLLLHTHDTHAADSPSSLQQDTTHGATHMEAGDGTRRYSPCALCALSHCSHLSPIQHTINRHTPTGRAGTRWAAAVRSPHTPALSRGALVRIHTCAFARRFYAALAAASASAASFAAFSASSNSFLASLRLDAAAISISICCACAIFCCASLKKA